VTRTPSAPAPEWGPEGGAWLGWGVYEAGGGDLDKPRKLTRCRALGGGLVDVVNASEAVALLSLPAQVPPLAVDPEWQAQLDWHRQSAGREAAPGEWLLLGLAPMKAVLFWGLVFKSSVSPWGSALDFNPAETWSQRWKRRCEEWGQPDLACPCKVGRTPSNGWAIEVPGSRVEQGGGAPSRLERTAPEAGWKEAVDAFALTMGIGKQAPGWVLLAVE
jgi:hypothetical protein